jgi:ribosomal protein S18 acetylase RimI-like enzyme
MTAVTTATVRPATESDIPRVLALWRDVRGAAASSRDTPDAVRQLTEHTPDALLVAELDGDIVGVVIAAWDGWRGNIYRLAVRRDCRRKGIGLQLVNAGQERLRDKGCQRVTVLVFTEELGAEALWKAAGYDHDRAVVRFVRNL